MQRVVVTGLGIVSSIGNNQQEVIDSLRYGKSGIAFEPAFAENGMKSNICGSIKNFDIGDRIDRKHLRFMRDAAIYSYIAMQDAISDAGLEEHDVSNPRTGIIAGSGGASNASIVEVHEIATTRGVKRIGPYRVTQTMGSTVSACLATPFRIKGINYSISSACSTSAHCVGNAMETIQIGKQDIVFAGGGEELCWNMASMFDAMGALSTNFNDEPHRASRAYDKDRDGFVIASGGAMLVLESLDHALTRGAKIYAELVGYGATSDGFDMVAPSGEGAVRCMQQALSTVDTKIDYINAHGTSTPAGDIKELEAVKTVFGQEANNIPHIGSTKSLAGHSLGATGAQEFIFSLLMMEHGFIAPSINIENLDSAAEGMPIARETIENADIQAIMSNSFGFGGTNATLIAKKYA